MAEAARPRKNTQFAELIKASEPQRLLEIGSWEGRSIITFLSEAKKIGLMPSALCVDTWLGSSEHWLNLFPGGDWAYERLDVRDGQPHVLETFKSNIQRWGLDDKVIILRAESRTALAYLAKKGEEFDFVFIDGGHEYQTVRGDIAGSAQLFSRNPTFICGDDWRWPGVRAAVACASLLGLGRILKKENFWCIVEKKGGATNRLMECGWKRVPLVEKIYAYLAYRLIRPRFLTSRGRSSPH